MSALQDRQATAYPIGELPAHPKLIVTDMDGTLLGPDGTIPEAFWEVLAGLQEAGITFTVASGRQYPSLAQLFHHPRGVVFIADNGGYAIRDGVELGTTPLSRASAEQVVAAVRALGSPTDLGAVWSGPT
ncbi:MAG: HAD family hydrolase, partial [Propioniciclava sp.]